MNRPMSVLFFLVAHSLLPLIASAQPVATTDVMFSVDDGATFQDVATVDELESFLVRLYFDNTGDAAGTGSSLAMTLPASFIRVAGTTRVCLEPTDGEILCNDDVGQSGAIDEGSVWAGQDLTISPSAGLFAQPVSQTAGLLEIGKSRYLNLHDCHYFNGAERFFTTADPDIAGTNISDTIDAAGACAGTVGAYGNAGQEVRTVDLFAHRYLNYHECHYNFFTDHIYRDTDGTATRGSNDLDAAFNCAGTAGAHILHPDSTVINFDLHGQRYLNLWECRFISGGDLISLNSVGSQTSSTPDAAPSCPSTLGAYTLNDSDHLALDTLDTTRGRGFVEVEVMAGTDDGDFDLDIALSGNEFATEMDTGTVTVLQGILPGADPSVDIKFSHDCGNSFVEDAVPFIGEEFITRIYFDNMGGGAGSDAQITTTLPAGLTLVPDSTRVCLSPSDGEEICNTDPGQGGAIDETAVWAGDVLAIAPSAGVMGEDPDATSGPIETGRKRYLNLHECHYHDGFTDRLFLTLDQGTTGTNLSNVVDTEAVCQPVAHGRNLVNGQVTTFDLLSQRYLNIHECQYQFFLADRIFLNGSGASGTVASNQIDGALNCAPTAGAHSWVPGESNLLTLDLAGQRYLNLHECVMLNGFDHIAILAGPSNGTSASQTDDTLAICPSTSGAHSLVTGTVAALDMLDPGRGRGFIEFRVTASETFMAEDQTAAINGMDFATDVDLGNVDASSPRLLHTGFECGTLEEWSIVVTP